MPLQIDPDSSDQNGYLSVAARVKPGVMIETAAAQVRLGTQEFRRKFPGVGGMPSGSVFTVQSMKDAMVNGELAPLSVLSGAVSLLLLIACANVANLLLARAVGRQREIAIRIAVGATRGRIIRQLLTEGAVLSAFGGVLGLILGIFGIRAFLSMHTISIPRIGGRGAAIILDWRVLFFTALISLTTGMLFGLIPALQAYRTDLSDALKDGSGHADTAFRHNKARSLLVVSQVAIALVLLAGAGLLIRSFIALRCVSPGFDPRNILTMRMLLTAPQFRKTSAVSELVREGVQRINALPGVVSAAATCCLPLEDRTIGDVIIAGRPLEGRAHGIVNLSTISPNYFDVFRIPVRRGREFTDRDVRGSPSVVVISEAMARRFWQRGTTLGDPLNERLVFPDLPASAWQIVGVVGDTHADGLSQSAPPTIYMPIAQAPDEFTAYLVRSPIAWALRTLGEPRGLTLAIQKELEQASGGLPVGDIRSMDQILVGSTGGREFNMLLLSIFGGSALALAALGIYGLIAHSVQHRTKEIGIRMALGAQLNDIRNMALMQGFRLTLLGIPIGIPAALSLTRLIKRFLFGLQPQDPSIFIAVSALLSLVAIFAVWLAARRASNLNPVDALHHE
jgi:predicted permease